MAIQPNYSDALYAARCIADHALRVGVLASRGLSRPVYGHMGAALADCTLQAGLNYSTVVRPRITSILRFFPDAKTVNTLIGVIEKEGVQKFLQWKHPERISRFENLIRFMTETGIDSTSDLCEALGDAAFTIEIRKIRGIGPKTIDYMGCLVGLDCIAVDRHIKNFAETAGLEKNSYDYLKETFNFAADLLSVSRREFDASIWQYQSNKSKVQIALEL